VEPERRLVCAAESLRTLVERDLGGVSRSQFLGEPIGRDTLAALGYTAAVIARDDPDATMGVFTADHIIEPVEQFRRIVESGYALAEAERSVLVTFGIAPRYPATSYGYLSLGAQLGRDAKIVEQFREKPDRATAERWVSEGPSRFLWNSGMFVWKTSIFLDCIRRYEPETSSILLQIADSWGTARFPEIIAAAYPQLRKISVDFAVMEKASRDPAVEVAAIPMDISWLDVGSWPAFAETCRGDDAGNRWAAEGIFMDTRGTLVASSDPQHLVAVLGCDDLVVIHTPDATLVCRWEKAEEIKKLQAMVAEKYGGRFV
jgi:mannose-1-phosphate guanylyltransferase